MYFYILVGVPSMLCATTLVKLLRIRKHDTVLFELCEVRRSVMRLLRDKGFNLKKSDYFAARCILESLNSAIHNYNEHKLSLFNFRSYMEFIRQSRAIDEQKKGAPKPENEEIGAIIARYNRAVAMGFLAYTPLIRSEITLRFSIVLLRLLILAGWKSLSKPFENLEWVHAKLENHQHA